MFLLVNSQSPGSDLDNESQFQSTFELPGIDLNREKSFQRQVENSTVLLG